MSDRDWLRTEIGGADADSITVRGRDLATELMGKVTFTELTFLLVQGRTPTPQETVLLDAVLVSLAEHGLTPTVLAARLTHTGAPESLQGAVASGLLGAGTVFLGVVEDTAVFLDGVLEAAGPGAGDDALARAAADAVRAQTRRREADPGDRPPGPQGRGPAHRPDLRDRGRAGARGATPASRCGSSPMRTATPRAGPSRSTGPGWRAPRSPISASRRGSSAAWRSWPGQRASSAHLDEEMTRPLGMPLFRDVERRAQDRLDRGLTHVEGRLARLLVGGERR